MSQCECVCELGLEKERAGHAQALDMTHYQYVSELDSFSECGTTLHNLRAVDKVGAMCYVLKSIPRFLDEHCDYMLCCF